MAPNTAQRRVIDPILTQTARGYVHPAHIAATLLPVVQVPVRGFKRIEFGKESFRRYNTRRAPGARVQDVMFGYEGKPATLHQHALSGLVPVEHQQEAQHQPGIDLGQEAVADVQAIVSLEVEVETADLVRDPARYDPAHVLAPTGGDKWSDDASDPLTMVLDGTEQIRRSIGLRPNTLEISAQVLAKLRRHPKIREHFKHTTPDNITTAMLQTYFGIANIIVGDAIYADDDGEMHDVWGADAILAYVAPSGQRRARVPSFGWTYRLQGHPSVEQPWFDRDHRSWKYPVLDELSPELVGPDAGILMQGVV